MDIERCEMHKTNIICPYFIFESTVNGEKYKYMLGSFTMPKILDLPGSLIFQQNGAPPHWVIDGREYFDTNLQQRWIGTGGRVAWRRGHQTGLF